MASIGLTPTSSDAVSASDLRSKFVAIEDGTVDHKKLTLTVQGAAPGATADKFKLYALDVNSGGTDYAEAHIVDEQNNTMQLTSNGRMGSPTTNATALSMKYGAGTASYGLGQMFSAWAFHDGTAGTTPTADFEMGVVARTNAADAATNGTFKFTFDTSMANANYAVFGTVDNTASNNARLVIVKARHVDYVVVSVIDETGTLVNSLPFSVVVFGGR